MVWGQNHFGSFRPKGAEGGGSGPLYLPSVDGGEQLSKPFQGTIDWSGDSFFEGLSVDELPGPRGKHTEPRGLEVVVHK